MRTVWKFPLQRGLVTSIAAPAEAHVVLVALDPASSSLAEAAIESEAIASLPDGAPGMRWPLDLGGVTIGMVEQGDGSIRIVP